MKEAPPKGAASSCLEQNRSRSGSCLRARNQDCASCGRPRPPDLPWCDACADIIDECLSATDGCDCFVGVDVNHEPFLNEPRLRVLHVLTPAARAALRRSRRRDHPL
jgi:hypothetical protein